MNQVLQNEIAWELTQPREANAAGYVLSRLRWTSTQIGIDLRDDILQLLSNRPTADAATLTEALTMVLRYPAPIPPSFSDLLARRVAEADNDEIKALWLGGLLCTDAERALPMLEDWVAAAEHRGAQEKRISKVLDYIWGDSFRRFDPQHQTFRRTSILLRLIKLCHVHINPADDIDHAAVAEDGGYTPGLRDHAEAARQRLLEILCEIPGPDTYHALVELSDFRTDPYLKDRMRVLAERRAEADAEGDPWAPADVDAFAAEAERSPRTQEDLFKLTTGSEEELADTTRTDIRLHHPDVDARIPIELKIADAHKSSAAALRDKLEEQLAEQYLREARYGIFLLVRCGRPGGRKSWPHQHLGKTFDFHGLNAWLREEAKDLVRATPSIDGLEVVAIDLTRR